MNESALAYGRHGDMSDFLAPALEGERKRKFLSLIDQIRQAVDEIEEAGNKCPSWLAIANLKAVTGLVDQARIVLRS